MRKYTLPLAGLLFAACASAPRSAPRTMVTEAEAPVVLDAPPPELSPADQDREIASTARTVSTQRWGVQRRLTSARERGDRPALRCLDAHLTELDATLRLVGEQHERFLSVVDDDARRAQSFRQVMLLRSRADEVREASLACDSERAGYTAATSVHVTAPE